MVSKISVSVLSTSTIAVQFDLSAVIEVMIYCLFISVQYICAQCSFQGPTTGGGGPKWGGGGGPKWGGGLYGDHFVASDREPAKSYI